MDAFTVEPTFHKGLLVAQPVRGYRFSMDSVLLPHLIEGRFVTAVELGAGCGIMALQLFAHGKTTLLHLAESNPLLFEALRLTTAINALDGFSCCIKLMWRICVSVAI